MGAKKHKQQYLLFTAIITLWINQKPQWQTPLYWAQGSQDHTLGLAGVLVSCSPALGRLLSADGEWPHLRWLDLCIIAQQTNPGTSHSGGTELREEAEKYKSVLIFMCHISWHSTDQSTSHNLTRDQGSGEEILPLQ